ncbi:chitinase [Methanocalculus sp. MC3]
MRLTKLAFLFLIILCGNSFFPATAAADWPEQVFAPYIDYGLWEGFTINDAYDATGVKYYTLCFITVNSAGKLRFADHTEPDWRLGDINALRAKGGDVIISFGGAGGEATEPAIKITNLTTLVEAYSSVIETYGVNSIDFDIEGAAVQNPGANSRRNQAIIRLKEKYPDLRVSVTLAVTPEEGFNAFEMAFLNDVQSAEERYKAANPGKEVLIFDRVNIMLMNYGDWYVKDPSKMGKYGIDASNAVHKQLKQGYYKGKSDAEVWKRMGLTPMIGQNDAKGEIFYQKDARELAEFAGSKGIGMMSIWSLTRDHGGCDGRYPPSATCSSIPQEKFEFTNIIKNFPSMKPSATAAPLPSQVYAPYIDVSLGTPDKTITSIAEKTGVKYFTLGFINAGNNNEPMWGWRPADGYYRDQIDGIRAMGGDVIISFGGAGGETTEFARRITDLDHLIEKYRSVINAYGVKNIDFDIEGAALNDQPSIDRRNRAIKSLQDSDTALYVSYTLPINPSGLTHEGLALIKSAKDAGVRIDRVNVMLMDYGGSAAPDPDGRMGDYGIEAAKNLFKQLKEIYSETNDAELWEMIGLTVMIGQNDVQAEVFYLEDALKVAEFAGDKGVGMMSIWSAHRDNGDGGRNVVASWAYSGIEQEDFAFSDIFKNYATMRPSAVITPEPTHATGFVPKWDSEKEYDTGDRVLHNLAMYAARWWTLGEEPGIEYVWMLVSGEPKPTPTPSTGLILEWNANTLYFPDNRVLYEGDMYAAKWLTIGEIPGSTFVWELISDIKPKPVPTPGTVTPTPATGLIPEWRSNQIYECGDTVLYEGGMYTARWRNKEEVPGKSYVWMSVSGEPMPAPTPSTGLLQVWSASKMYLSGDIVIYKDYMYRASWRTKGEIPGKAYVWELVSEVKIPTPTPTPTPTPIPTPIPTPTPDYSRGLLPPPVPDYSRGLLPVDDRDSGSTDSGSTDSGGLLGG